MNERRVSYGFLSSAPPTPCGIATFTAALGSTLKVLGADVSIVRVLDEPQATSESALAVLANLVAADKGSIPDAVEALNSCDVAVVQHEYGLYGGRDGDDVVKVLEGLYVPCVVILHTILPTPTEHQRAVLRAVIDRADTAVVMSQGAAATLHELYDLGGTPVEVIAHGAAVNVKVHKNSAQRRPIVLTWGLLGPGKGIEWVIDAMKNLSDLVPQPLYIVAGRTHPKVLAHQGERYRQFLERRVTRQGLEEMVHFDNSYRELSSLNLLIDSADVVVLPYDSLDQATSGVLVDAIAAGRPVVATEFPHARELLATGAGVTVPHQNPGAIALALRRILTDNDAAHTMAREARRLASSLSWDKVGLRYQAVAHHLLERADVRA